MLEAVGIDDSPLEVEIVDEAALEISDTAISELAEETEGAEIG